MAASSNFFKHAGKFLRFSSPVIFGFGLGYVTKQHNIKPDEAVDTLYKEQKTWRLQYHPGSQGGLWASPFKSRFTGMSAYVLFHDTVSQEQYILLTLQERIVPKTGEKVMVCEPPMGFFNGEFLGAIPHIVVEQAEREVEKLVRQKLPADRAKLIAYYLEQYNANRLSHQEYQVDNSLAQDKDGKDTLTREVEEEAGLDLKSIRLDKEYKVEESVLGEYELPGVYSSIRQVVITGQSWPPHLKYRNNEEIEHAQWINLKDINLNTMSVKTVKGDFPLKGWDRVPEYITKIVNESRVQQDRRSGNSL